jgi:poly(A) polymerase
MSAKKTAALNLIRLLEENGYPTRLVGGSVRDEYLGLVPKDYDIATAATPEQIEKVLRTKRIKCLDFGKKHGTITAVVATGSFEITSLREDVTTDGRHATVAFHADFVVDAKRRDFTINAMSEDAQGNIFDPFAGRQHLAEKRLVFVGDAEARIKEDYLRILRFFRFKTRFQLRADEQALEAIAKNCKGLQGLSRERITHELLLTFCYQDMEETAQDMLQTGVLEALFSSFMVQDFRKLCVPLLGTSLHDAAIMRFAVLHMSKRSWPLALKREDQRYLEGLQWARQTLGSLSDDRVTLLLWMDRCEAKTQKAFSSSVAPFLAALFPRDKIHGLLQAEQKWGHLRGKMPLKAKDLEMHQLAVPGPEMGQKLQQLYRLYLAGQWETLEEGLSSANSMPSQDSSF